jgi:capsular polysaccharide biosynthesis protein
MDVVFILRELWRQRVLVAVVAVFAVLLGGFTAYSPGLPPTSRQHEVGVASSRALVDTPNSQVADLGLTEPGTDPVSLPARAALLANLLSTAPLRDEIAKRAGVAPELLITSADTPTDTPQRKTEITTGASVKPGDPRANTLIFHTDDELPLITVNAQAPTAQTASRLADSSIEVLEQHLASVVNDTGVPSSRRLVVEKLGVPGAATQNVGPSRLIAFIVTLIVFVIGCASLVGVSALIRGWREAAALEQAFDAAPDPFGSVSPRAAEDEEEIDDDDDDEDAGTPRRGFLRRRAAGGLAA